MRRGIISPDSQLCVSGCGNNETTNHILSHCPVFGVLWQLVKTWIGLISVDPQHILHHFLQFAYSLGGFKPRWSFLQLIWLCSVYVFWNERNHILFSNKVNLLWILWKRSKLLLWIGWKLKMFVFLLLPFVVAATSCLFEHWLTVFFVIIQDTLLLLVLLFFARLVPCARE